MRARSPATLTLCASLLAVACDPPSITDKPQPADTDAADGDTDTDTDTDADTDSDADLPFDCDQQPRGPYDVRSMTAYASEDLAFDDEGHLLGSDMLHIYKSTYGGDREVWVPNLPFRAGMRRLSTGQVVIANEARGALMLIEPDGSYDTVVGGLRYPNGLEIGRDDMVYLTEHDGHRVLRIDPFTGEVTVLLQEVIRAPNGISFNEDFTALYLAGFDGEQVIYRLPIDDEGNPGELEVFADDVGTGWLDGIAVDRCGNVYVADYGSSRILRYGPDGEYDDLIVNGRDLGFHVYMPNMDWGSGIGGWDSMKLYVPEGWQASRTFEVDLGIPGKER
jgi:hypothetical protein